MLSRSTLLLLLLLLLHPFNGLFSRTTWVSQYHKGKTSLDLNEARDDGVLGCSGISWTICKQSAPHSRQITTPTTHQSFFNRPDAPPDVQPTVSKTLKANLDLHLHYLDLHCVMKFMNIIDCKHTHTHTHPFNGCVCVCVHSLGDCGLR